MVGTGMSGSTLRGVSGVKTMKTFMIILALLLTGCATTYEYTDGTKTFKSKSYRDFKSLEATYGDFHVVARGVTDDTAEAVMAIADDIADAIKIELGEDE